MRSRRRAGLAAASLDRLSKRYGATTGGRRRLVRGRPARGIGPARAERLGQDDHPARADRLSATRAPGRCGSAASTSCARDALRAGGVGYVPEDAPLYRHMRVSEFLAFMGRLRGLARREPATGAWRSCASGWRSTMCVRSSSAGCPAAIASAWRSPRPSCTSPNCWCSMSRPTAWTRARSSSCVG